MQGHTNDVLDLRKDRYELMQFTGLKDKNGREIYEGGLIDVGWSKSDRGVHEVRFIDGCFIYEDHYELQLAVESAEVIGNIYENPDLLEKGRKGNTEWAGPCPVCRPKNNGGKLQLPPGRKIPVLQLSGQRPRRIRFSDAGGEVGFQQAVEILKTIPHTGGQHENANKKRREEPEEDVVLT